VSIRNPVVAGRFYSDQPNELRKEVGRYLSPKQPQKAFAVVVPHAGYVYSGKVAGEVYSSVILPERIVILCPNHTGRGASFALWPEGKWKTPLGFVEVDEAMAAKIQSHCHFLEESRPAHEQEHSLEVQLPFLQVLLSRFSIVPICIRDLNPMKLIELGDALAESIRGWEEPVLIIASSDMNHYEQDSITRDKDCKAIERMISLDALGLLQTVAGEAISMCGVGPAVCAIQAAKGLGAEKGLLVCYATSGDISGDFRQVVGYAGIAMV
jgi:MEMO1 family protein